METTSSNILKLPDAARLAFARRMQQRISAKMNGKSGADCTAAEAAAADGQAAPDAQSLIFDIIETDISETGRNERLRRERRAVWQTTQAKLDYWRAYRKLHFAIHQNREVLDDLEIPAALRRKHGDFSEPWVLDNELLIRIHAAEIKLLLTPAPDIASLNWKRQRVKHQWYQMPNADSEYLRRHFGREQSPFRDIEQAIADDEAWLKAHPARQCKTNSARGSTEN